MKKLGVCFRKYILLIVVILISLLTVTGLSTENFYYSYYSGKHKLELSTEMIGVRFKEGVSLEEEEVIVEAEPNLKPFSERAEYSNLGLVAFMVKEGLSEDDVLQTIDNLDTKSEVEFATPVFNLGQEIAPPNAFSLGCCNNCCYLIVLFFL